MVSGDGGLRVDACDRWQHGSLPLSIEPLALASGRGARKEMDGLVVRILVLWSRQEGRKVLSCLVFLKREKKIDFGYLPQHPLHRWEEATPFAPNQSDPPPLSLQLTYSWCVRWCLTYLLLFDCGRYRAFLATIAADPTPAPTRREIIAPTVLNAASVATR